MNSLLAKVLFRERTRFFHKLHSLGEIIEELQTEARAIIAGISDGASQFPIGPGSTWKSLVMI